ncbi:MAG: bifunctional pyr operon transcriptional regulator/uracil phosphoribosyltransferase PyrR [Betaproteobacteria bacterium]|nr:bifunctional pyr operon transcriptional regulator/uracil phosphoribosyltransferase PyrR [Betaproteobacteria bacterium]
MILPEAETLYARLAAELVSWVKPTSALIGIHTGGAWLAERLHAALGIGTELGTLDAAFYRDDYRQQGLAKEPKRSQVPFPVEGRDLLLVDDVLHTGRTVRAAMNELFDYGRPASISLAVLADRGGRELPICAQYCATRIELPAGKRLRLTRDAAGRLAFELEDGE